MVVGGVRDDALVIIDTGHIYTRAGVGLGKEGLPLHTVILPTAVGKASDKQNEGRLVTGTVVSNGTISPSRTGLSAAGTQYLAGVDLEKAIARGEEFDLTWPLEEEHPDVEQLEALWSHLLIDILSVKRVRNESPVLLVVPTALLVSAYYNDFITQLFFEAFNVPAFAMIERPLALVFAVGSTAGLVIDVTDRKSHIDIIFDGAVVAPAMTSGQLGLRDCDAWLAHLLRADPYTAESVQKLKGGRVEGVYDTAYATDAYLRLARRARGSGIVHVASDLPTRVATAEDDEVFDINAALEKSKKAADDAGDISSAALDAPRAPLRPGYVEVELEGERIPVSIALGERYGEPLIDPDVLTAGVNRPWAQPAERFAAQPISEVVRAALARVESERLNSVWDTVVVAGEGTTVRGFAQAIFEQVRVHVADIDTLSETQTRQARLTKLPDYFPNFKDSPASAAFLGGSVVAKLAFGDPSGQLYITRANYNEHGPSTGRSSYVKIS